MFLIETQHKEMVMTELQSLYTQSFRDFVQNLNQISPQKNVFISETKTIGLAKKSFQFLSLFLCQ